MEFSDKRGQVLIIGAFFVFLLFGIVALVVDVGRAYLLYQRLVTACDAAALAGAFKLPNDPTAAKEAALEFILKNGFTHIEATITTPYQDDKTKSMNLRNSRAIEVLLKKDVGFVFAPILHIYGKMIKARAVAIHPYMLHRWDFDTMAPVYSSVVTANGIVYVGSSNGVMFALDAEDGERVWVFNTTNGSLGRYIDDKKTDWQVDTASYAIYGHNSLNGIHSMATVVGGIIYFASTNGYLYALDGSSGIPKWQHYIGLDSESKALRSSSPTVYNGVVYIGSFDGRIYAINVSNGSEIFNYKTQDMVISSPVVVDGVLYCGSNDNRLYAFDIKTSGGLSLKWVYTANGKICGRPFVYKDRVYFGAGKSDIYALNAMTGALIWRYNTGRNPLRDIVSSAIVEIVNEGGMDKRVVHIGDGAGFAMALEENDASNGVTLKWEEKLGYMIDGSPAVMDGRVYYGVWNGSSNNDGGTFYILDSANGDVLQDFKLSHGVSSMIQLTERFAYYGCGDGLIYGERIDTPTDPLVSMIE